MVAREAEHLEIIGMLGTDLFVQSLKTTELRGEAAFRSSVYDNNNFAFEVGERVGTALFWCILSAILIALGPKCWVLIIHSNVLFSSHKGHIDVLSRGLNSKKFVADAIVLICVGGVASACK